MAKEVVNTFWDGRDLSPIECACLRSFIERGIRVRVFAYRDLAVPRGIQVEDANDIIASNGLFLFEGSPSAFTNIFRYKLLLEHGGWWVDTDVLILAARLPKCRYFWAWQDCSQINGAVLKFPRGDPICEKLLNLSLERSPNLERWGQLGPDLLTEVLSENGLRNHAVNTQLVYPIHWLETHYLWFPEFSEFVRKRISESYFLHLWNSMFSKMGINLGRKPPRGGYLDALVGTAFESIKQLEDEHNCQSMERASVIEYLSRDGIDEFWRKSAPSNYTPLLLPSRIRP